MGQSNQTNQKHDRKYYNTLCDIQQRIASSTSNQEFIDILNHQELSKLNFFLWAIYCKNHDFVEFMINLALLQGEQSLYNGLQGFGNVVKESNFMDIKTQESPMFTVKKQKSFEGNLDAHLKEQLLQSMKATDCFGNSAYHITAFVNDILMVKFLNQLQEMIPANSTNNHGETPLQLAILYNHHDVIPYLSHHHQPTNKSNLLLNHNVHDSDDDSIKHLKALETESANVMLTDGNHVTEIDHLMLNNLRQNQLSEQKDISNMYHGFQKHIASFKRRKDQIVDNPNDVEDISSYESSSQQASILNERKITTNGDIGGSTYKNPNKNYDFKLT